MKQKSAWHKTTLTLDRRRVRNPRLIKVTDRVYSSVGYALSNAIYILTNESVVVIDTTESAAAAQASLDELRKFCQLPIKYIIYTHFHGDHINGAGTYWSPDTKIIAQRRILDELAKNDLLLPYRRRITGHQFAFKTSVWDGSTPRVRRQKSTYVPPDITFDDDYRFEEGGISFELRHTMGETRDHLMVWLPNEKVLFPGDLFYASFPMLSNPMKPDRPVLGWAQSLEMMRGLGAEYFVPSHGVPISGAEQIDLTLANYARAIHYIHDETVRLINEGATLEHILQQVKLPKGLASLPYLQENYGKVEWAVRGIFRQYTGWFTFDPKDLKPSPRPVFNRALVEASGGVAALIRRARRALLEDQPQLALELADIVINVKAGSRRAHLIRSEALNLLAAAAKNNVERNIYSTALRLARKTK